MITAIEIENFKAIRDRVRVELKPITLLFGPNSAGKSTVVQALHYAREILERHNLDPDRTIYGGDAVELGGFRNLVYNHDATRSITLRFDLDLRAIDLSEEVPEIGPLAGKLQSSISARAESASIELVVRWSLFLGSPLIISYAVDINGQPIARITASEDGKRIALTDINLHHPIFYEPGKAGQQRLAVGPSDLELLYSAVVKDSDEVGVLQQRSALPNWDASLVLDVEEPESDNEQFESYLDLVGCLNELLLAPGRILRQGLRGFRYLGPLRQIPPRNYEPARSQDEARWASGLAAWDALHRNGEEFVRSVSDWMFRPDRLDAGYELRLKRYKELDAAGPLMLSLSPDRALDDIEDLRGELEKLPTKSRLVLVEGGKEIEILPPDVGVGVSQVLPVVVAALDDSSGFVAIEQPELHIHPAIQVNLGDLFISQIGQGTKVFLLETHSEHLLLRLLRRIRETAADDLPPGAAPLRPEQLAVFYVEQTPDGAKLYKLRVDEAGEFIDRWPKGFFEERVDEIL